MDDNPNIKRIVQHFGAGVGKTDDSHLLQGVVPGMTTVIEHEGRGYAPRPTTTPPTFQRKKTPERIPRSRMVWKVETEFPHRYVTSLASYNGMLYAATATTGVICRKNGITWEESFDSGEQSIESLAVYQNVLYAGSSYNGKIFAYTAASGWFLHATLGTGVESISALYVYDDVLYAGTYYQGKVFAYNGTSWNLVYESGHSAIRSFAEYNGNLYAGSYFWSADEAKIFVFNGSTWQLSITTPRTAINALGTYGGILYAGGYGGIAGNILYVYNGSTWAEEEMSGIITSGISAFGIFQNALYVGGEDIYRRGDAWRTVYTSPVASIYTLISFKNRFYAGGGNYASGTDATVFVQRRQFY